LPGDLLDTTEKAIDEAGTGFAPAAMQRCRNLADDLLFG
jgi:hypothetical protein